MKHFIDGGANIGQTFKDYLVPQRLFDYKIWCFEPSPRNLAGLLSEVDRQSAAFDITICPFALSDEDGLLAFYEKVNDPRGDSLSINLWNEGVRLLENTRRKLLVSAISIDRFILGQTSPGDEVFIKLDVEGAEYKILQKLLRSPDAMSRVSKILVEWHRTDEPGNDTRAISLGFYKIGKPLGQWMF